MTYVVFDGTPSLEVVSYVLSTPWWPFEVHQVALVSGQCKPWVMAFYVLKASVSNVIAYRIYNLFLVT